jgi:hypothetical protein
MYFKIFYIVQFYHVDFILVPSMDRGLTSIRLYFHLSFFMYVLSVDVPSVYIREQDFEESGKIHTQA